MRRLFLFVVLLIGCLALVACGGVASPEIEQGEVSLPGSDEVMPRTVTATPKPNVSVEPEASGRDTMIICMAQEPSTLLWSEPSLVASAVLQAVKEPLIDTHEYGYQANLVEKLPSFDEGDATLETVIIAEGDRFYDAVNNRILTATAGMTETFALNQVEGGPIEHEGWNGSEVLAAAQITANWTLLEGMTWEDGEPITADDSVYGFEISSDPDWTVSRFINERTASYTATGTLTVQWVGLPGYMDGTYYINIWNPQPRHAYGEMSVPELQQAEAANRDPLGYGAYLVDEWVAGERITLSRNASYIKGPPPLNTLIFRFIPDTNQLIAQLAAGECDVGTQEAAFEGSLPLIHRFEEQGLLKALRVAGTAFELLAFNMLPVESYTGAAATLRTRSNALLFQQVGFRRAIVHCIDRQAIIDQATNGTTFLQHGYTAVVHPLYPGDDAVTIYAFNPQIGLSLLAELGWADTDGDGFLDNGQGQKLSFVHSARQNALREKITQIMQAQLRENCQIETTIEQVGSEYFSPGPDGLLFGRKFDLGEFAFPTGVEPPCNLYRGSDIPNEGNGWAGLNIVGFANAAFDAACNAAAQTLDPKAKAEQHAIAMQIFTEQIPSIPLFTRATLVVVRPDVENVIIDPTINSELWNVEHFTFASD